MIYVYCSWYINNYSLNVILTMAQAFPAVQVCPCFSSTFPVVLGGHRDPKRLQLTCLVPCAIDQDPYFRLARGVAGRLKEKKCALIHSKFVPGLQGNPCAYSSVQFS